MQLIKNVSFFLGHFCPEGTDYDIKFPCDEGTYNDQFGASNATFCSPCPPGNYCEGRGNAEPGLPCDPGFFCRGKPAWKGQILRITKKI